MQSILLLGSFSAWSLLKTLLEEVLLIPQRFYLAHPRFTSNHCTGLVDISLGNIYDDYSADAIYYFLSVIDMVIHDHVQNVHACEFTCVDAVGL